MQILTLTYFFVNQIVIKFKKSILSTVVEDMGKCVLLNYRENTISNNLSEGHFTNMNQN